MLEDNDNEDQKNCFPKCEVCGVHDGTVDKMIDPYRHDMFNEDVEITICEDCYNDKRMSI